MYLQIGLIQVAIRAATGTFVTAGPGEADYATVTPFQNAM